MLERLLKTAILIFIIFIAACTGCAADRQARSIIERSNSSCDLAHLGKNKYFYSHHYQRLLADNKKKIKKR